MHEQIVKKSTVIRQSLGVAQLKIAVVVHPKIMKHIKDWLPTSALCAYMTLFNQNTHLPLIAGYLNPVRYNGLLERSVATGMEICQLWSVKKALTIQRPFIQHS